MRWLPFLAVLLLVPSGGAAHLLDLGRLEIAIKEGVVEERLLVPIAVAATLLRKDGEGRVDALEPEATLSAFFETTLGRSPLTLGQVPCRLAPVALRQEGAELLLVARGRCERSRGTLRQWLAFVRDLPEGHRIVVSATVDGSRSERVVDRMAPLVMLEGTRASGFGSFVRLGVEHIFTGWDHLVFLLGLVLGGGSLRRLFLVVTAFTVAHSVTLALAALGVVGLPGRLVEGTIAATIVWVSAENYLGVGERRRWALAFLFGLVHGFGFATALVEMKLTPAALARGLVGFNVGVELGQAALIAPAVPLAALLRRRPRLWRPFLSILSLVSLALGAYWFVVRIARG